MENVSSLIEILNSQKKLYSELLSLLKYERETVGSWDADGTFELAKKKDTLVYKEKLLDEARNTAVRKISRSAGKEMMTVSEIIEELDDEEAIDTLCGIRAELLKLAKKIKDENDSLKILYKTNIGFVNDLFTQLGLDNRPVYSNNKTVGAAKNSSLDTRG